MHKILKIFKISLLILASVLLWQNSAFSEDEDLLSMLSKLPITIPPEVAPGEVAYAIKYYRNEDYTPLDSLHFLDMFIAFRKQYPKEDVRKLIKFSVGAVIYLEEGQIYKAIGKTTPPSSWKRLPGRYSYEEWLATHLANYALDDENRELYIKLSGIISSDPLLSFLTDSYEILSGYYHLEFLMSKTLSEKQFSRFHNLLYKYPEYIGLKLMDFLFNRGVEFPLPLHDYASRLFSLHLKARINPKILPVIEAAAFIAGAGSSAFDITRGVLEREFKCSKREAKAKVNTLKKTENIQHFLEILRDVAPQLFVTVNAALKRLDPGELISLLELFETSPIKENPDVALNFLTDPEPVREYLEIETDLGLGPDEGALEYGQLDTIRESMLRINEPDSTLESFAELATMLGWEQEQAARMRFLYFPRIGENVAVIPPTSVADDFLILVGEGMVSEQIRDRITEGIARARMKADAKLDVLVALWTMYVKLYLKQHMALVTWDKVNAGRFEAILNMGSYSERLLEAVLDVSQVDFESEGVVPRVLQPFYGSEASGMTAEAQDSALKQAWLGDGTAGWDRIVGTKLDRGIGETVKNLWPTFLKLAEVFAPDIVDVLKNYPSFAEFVRNVDNGQKETLEAFLGLGEKVTERLRQGHSHSSIVIKDIRLKDGITAGGADTLDLDLFEQYFRDCFKGLRIPVIFFTPHISSWLADNPEFGPYETSTFVSELFEFVSETNQFAGLSQVLDDSKDFIARLVKSVGVNSENVFLRTLFNIFTQSSEGMGFIGEIGTGLTSQLSMASDDFNTTFTIFHEQASTYEKVAQRIWESGGDIDGAFGGPIPDDGDPDKGGGFGEDEDGSDVDPFGGSGGSPHGGGAGFRLSNSNSLFGGVHYRSRSHRFRPGVAPALLGLDVFGEAHYRNPLDGKGGGVGLLEPPEGGTSREPPSRQNNSASESNGRSRLVQHGSGKSSSGKANAASSASVRTQAAGLKRGEIVLGDRNHGNGTKAGREFKSFDDLRSRYRSAMSRHRGLVDGAMSVVNTVGILLAFKTAVIAEHTARAETGKSLIELSSSERNAYLNRAALKIIRSTEFSAEAGGVFLSELFVNRPLLSKVNIKAMSFEAGLARQAGGVVRYLGAAVAEEVLREATRDLEGTDDWWNILRDPGLALEVSKNLVEVVSSDEKLKRCLTRAVYNGLLNGDAVFMLGFACLGGEAGLAIGGPLGLIVGGMVGAFSSQFLPSKLKVEATDVLVNFEKNSGLNEINEARSKISKHLEGYDRYNVDVEPSDHKLDALLEKQIRGRDRAIHALLKIYLGNLRLWAKHEMELRQSEEELLAFGADYFPRMDIPEQLYGSGAILDNRWEMEQEGALLSARIRMHEEIIDKSEKKVKKAYQHIRDIFRGEMDFYADHLQATPIIGALHERVERFSQLMESLLDYYSIKDEIERGDFEMTSTLLALQVFDPILEDDFNEDLFYDSLAKALPEKEFSGTFELTSVNP